MEELKLEDNLSTMVIRPFDKHGLFSIKIIDIVGEENEIVLSIKDAIKIANFFRNQYDTPVLPNQS